jgi:hypothetical protein
VISSAYLFAEDVVDESLSVVVDRLRGAGLDSATLAAAYHHSRDVFPHGVHRKVQHLQGGVVYFHPDLSRYGAIKPVVADCCSSSDVLALLSARMPCSAWLVVLHNSRLAEQHPDCAPETAFGDRLLDGLCPANPDARAYAVALASDLARYHLQAIKLEAVHYMGFDHGGHHERSFVPLSPDIRFLLGLCFCPSCVAAASDFDVDVPRLRALVVARIQAVFDRASASAETRETDLDDDAMRSLLGGYVAARERVVTSLVAQIADAIHAVAPATRVVYLDPCGATLGYASGRPSTQQTAVSIGWRDGINVTSLSKVADGIGLLGYFQDASRFQRELGGYLDLVSAERLEVILRPMPPDITSASALRERAALLRQHGIGETSFYHYGFMRLENLEWIRQALQ